MTTKMDKIVDQLQQEEAANTEQTTENTTETTTEDNSADEVTQEKSDAQSAQESTTAEEQPQSEVPAEQNAVDTKPDFDRAKAFDEIEALLKEPVKVTQKEEQEPEPEPTPEEQENFRKKYEEEVQRRVALQWEKAELEAMVKYQQNMLDKQGDKQLTIIDKQKEMEIELRRAQAAQAPEEVAPLCQSYSLFQESWTPAHKYRLINQALELVQKVTWVSAEDYMQKIILAENKDIPNIEGVTTTPKPTEPERKPIISF